MCTLAAVNSVAVQAEDEYMISDYDLFVNKFISVPKDMGALNCAAFVAGIVKGVLDGAGFRARSALHHHPVLLFCVLLALVVRHLDCRTSDL